MIVDDFGNEVPTATVQGINQRLDEGDARMTRIEGDLKTNTEATQAVAASTAELVELVRAMKGAIKVLNWVGNLARPMAYVIGLGTALLGLWTALKGHMR